MSSLRAGGSFNFFRLISPHVVFSHFVSVPVLSIPKSPLSISSSNRLAKISLECRNTQTAKTIKPYCPLCISMSTFCVGPINNWWARLYFGRQDLDRNSKMPVFISTLAFGPFFLSVNIETVTKPFRILVLIPIQNLEPNAPLLKNSQLLRNNAST